MACPWLYLEGDTDRGLGGEGTTERKSPGVSFETWIDRQIREATERGEFDDARERTGDPGCALDVPSEG